MDKIKTIFNYFVKVLQCIFSPVFVLLMLSHVACCVLFWFPCRTIVSILAKLFRKDLNGLLKPLNVLLAIDYFSTVSEFNIHVCTFYSGEKVLELVKERLMERIFLPLITNPRISTQGFEYENLRCSLTTFCGFYAWKLQKEFRIDDYVKTYTELYTQENLEQSEDQLPLKDVYDDKDLKTIISALTTKKWRENYSPWQILVLENYRKSSEFDQDSVEGEQVTEAETELQTVVIFQFHHCLCDGLSFLNIITRLQDTPPPLAVVPHVKNQSRCAKILLTLVMPFKIFWDLVYFFATTQMDSNDWINAEDTPNKAKYHITWTPSIPIERIKKLKTKFDVSFLAITMAAGTGAMRKLMIASGAKVPEKVLCFVPFPLPNHRYGLRIHCATAIMYVHIGEQDTVKRVVKTQKTLRQISGSTVSMTFYRLAKAWALLPHFVVKYYKALGLTWGMSPFPGLSNRGHLTPKHTVTRAFFTIGLISFASAVASMTTVSHDGNIIFALTARRNVVPSRSLVEKFNQYLEEELDALEKAYNQKLKV